MSMQHPANDGQAPASGGALPRFVLFGSRARGTHHAGSDVDVLMFGEAAQLAALKEALRPLARDSGGPLDLYTSDFYNGELPSCHSGAERTIVLDSGDPDEAMEALLLGARDISLEELKALCLEAGPSWRAQHAVAHADQQVHAEVAADLALMDVVASVREVSAPRRRRRP